MTKKDPVDEYLERAIEIVAELEAGQIPDDKLDEARHAVSSELAELESLAAARPLRAQEIEAVAARYRSARTRLQEELGSKLH